MTTGKHSNVLAWTTVQRSLLAAAPMQYRIASLPEIFFYVAPGASQVGLRIQQAFLPETLPSTPPTIDCSFVFIEGRSFLEFRTTVVDLFESFFHFGTSIADRIVNNRVPPILAYQEALADWRELLWEPSATPENISLGIWGELQFLSELVRSIGPEAVFSWFGPMGEVHDFRLEGIDIEVKSTLSQRRTHHIHGSNQLDPAQGRTLLLLSIQACRSNEATASNNSTLVDGLRASLKIDNHCLEHFTRMCEHIPALHQSSREHEPRFKLLNEPLLYRVDSAFPRIDSAALTRIVGPEISRIREVTYLLDLEGLSPYKGLSEFTLDLHSKGVLPQRT